MLSRELKAAIASLTGLMPIKPRSWLLLKVSPDITIEKLRHKLSEQGLFFGYGTIRRFFERHKITRKKRSGYLQPDRLTL
jgi:hypothetical protein